MSWGLKNDVENQSTHILWEPLIVVWTMFIRKGTCIEAVVASSYGSLEGTGTHGFPPFLPSSLPINLGVWPPEGVYS